MQASFRFPANYIKRKPCIKCVNRGQKRFIDYGSTVINITISQRLLAQRSKCHILG